MQEQEVFPSLWQEMRQMNEFLNERHDAGQYCASVCMGMSFLRNRKVKEMLNVCMYHVTIQKFSGFDT